MSKTIKVNELKQGDILLFSHTDEWDSKLISLITDSPVSHAAMSYYDYSEIVEETPPCAVVAKLKERKVGREITVMRLKKYEDMTKVLDIAKKYVNEKEPYANANLVFILIYLLFEKATISLKLQKLLCTLMKFVMSELIKLIDDVFRKDTHPMVCSQFVYNCYETAGEEYKLKISAKSSSKCILSKIKEYIENNRESLKGKLSININQIKAKNDSIIDINKDELLKSIYEEITFNSNQELLMNSDKLDEDFVSLVCEFSLILNNLYNNTECNEGFLESDNNVLNNIIDKLYEMEEYFVTPGDLLFNCDDLKNVGILE